MPEGENGAWKLFFFISGGLVQKEKKILFRGNVRNLFFLLFQTKKKVEKTS